MLKEELLEEVLERSNLQAAYLSVKANKGAAGIDGIGTEDLGGHLCAHWVGIKAKLLAGRYKPSPVRPVATVARASPTATRPPAAADRRAHDPAAPACRNDW